MNIGEALVVCTVLVLAVFRPDFRKFLLWALGIGAALCVLAAGVWWGWSAYQKHEDQVAATKHHADANACVKRLTGIDPDSTSNTLPANWFDAVDACEKNAAAQLVDLWKDVEPQKISGSIVEIRGGETLKIVQEHNPPKGFIPIVYLGHKQEFVFSCGNFGEQGRGPIVAATTTKCP